MIPQELLADYLIDQKSAMKELVTCFLNDVMELEAANQIGAKPYERTKDRKAQRNGKKKRSLKTRYGTVILDRPHFRNASFETEVFSRYSRVEKALQNAIIESYIEGVSTRKIQKVISQLGVERISASEVSRIAKELDEKVDEFLKRSIEPEIRYLFIDASYFKIRSAGKYVNKALFVATGVSEEGIRQILGAKIADNEGESFWSEFFDDLNQRGLRGVQLVISDGHKGIQKAMESSFLGASWQMCTVHLVRAVLKNVKNKDKPEIAEKLNCAIEDEAKMQDLAAELRNRGYSKAADTIDHFIFDLWNYKAYPRAHWKRIRTTNGMERINKELKRRSRVIGAFPNERSFLRLAGSILMDIDEEWMTSKKYLAMEVQ